MKPIYLDYGATSPVRPEVMEILLPFFQKEYANAGSIHDFGQRSRDAIELARKQVADSLGASSPREIIFTGSGTEANNLAILGAARKHRNRGNHVITTSIEHPSVLEACKQLEKEGFEVTYLPVDPYGRISVEQVKDALTEQTILVSVMAANNEVGTLQPIKEIGRLLRDTPVLFHTDAVQFYGKIPFSVQELGVDLLSVSGHKIYGPKGIGALYIKKGIRIEPVLFGGAEKEACVPRPKTRPESSVWSSRLSDEPRIGTRTATVDPVARSVPEADPKGNRPSGFKRPSKQPVTQQSESQFSRGRGTSRFVGTQPQTNFCFQRFRLQCRETCPFPCPDGHGQK